MDDFFDPKQEGRRIVTQFGSPNPNQKDADGKPLNDRGAIKREGGTTNDQKKGN
jgi:hypothetical protein